MTGGVGRVAADILGTLSPVRMREIAGGKRSLSLALALGLPLGAELLIDLLFGFRFGTALTYTLVVGLRILVIAGVLTYLSKAPFGGVLRVTGLIVFLGVLLEALLTPIPTGLYFVIRTIFLTAYAFAVLPSLSRAFPLPLASPVVVALLMHLSVFLGRLF